MFGQNLIWSEFVNGQTVSAFITLLLSYGISVYIFLKINYNDLLSITWTCLNCLNTFAGLNYKLKKFSNLWIILLSKLYSSTTHITYKTPRRFIKPNSKPTVCIYFSPNGYFQNKKKPHNQSESEKIRSQYGGVIRGGQPQFNSSVIVPAREHMIVTAFPPKWPRVCGITVWYCHRQTPGLYSIVISQNRLSPLSLWLLQTI